MLTRLHGTNVLLRLLLGMATAHASKHPAQRALLLRSSKLRGTLLGSVGSERCDHAGGSQSKTFEAIFASISVDVLTLETCPHRNFLTGRGRGDRLRLLALVAVHRPSKIHLAARAGPVVGVLAGERRPSDARGQRRSWGAALIALAFRLIISFAALAQPIALLGLASPRAFPALKLTHQQNTRRGEEGAIGEAGSRRRKGPNGER